jgi:hypothetical protein
VPFLFAFPDYFDPEEGYFFHIFLFLSVHPFSCFGSHRILPRFALNNNIDTEYKGSEFAENIAAHQKRAVRILLVAPRR